jgi:hypothetical protein
MVPANRRGHKNGIGRTITGERQDIAAILGDEFASS